MASPDADVRRRAVLALAELPGDDVIATLTGALADTDTAVRRHAALALGARGHTAAVPVLVETVVEGPNDVEAAELLGALARDANWAERIMTALADEFATHTAEPAVRTRLTQALGEIPGARASDMLAELTGDDDRAVALTAAALRTIRETHHERPE